MYQLARLAFLLAAVGAPVSMAHAMPVGFTGSLVIDFSDGADALFGPIVIPVSGSANVSGGTLAIAAGEITASGATALVSDGAPVTKVEFTFVNAAGSFGPDGAPMSQRCTAVGTVNSLRACVNGGGFGGVLPLLGLFRLYGTGTQTQALTSGGEGVGVGGTVSATGLLTGAPWTTGQATASTYFTGLNAVGSLSGALGPGAVMNLVTPIAFDSGNGDPTLSPQFSGFASLQIQLVPEPGTLVLLALCAAAVLSLGIGSRARSERPQPVRRV